jgi:hypothetical protein
MASFRARLATPVLVLTLMMTGHAWGATCDQNSTLARPIPLGVSGGNINANCTGGGLSSLAAAAPALKGPSQPSQAYLDCVAVVDENKGWLMKLPGVYAVGVGLDADGNPIIVVQGNITAELESQIPSTLGGFPVKLEQMEQPQG